MPATRKHLHVSKPRRRQRSVSLATRASRCGVKNFNNVLKNLHPQVILFFPVTKEYMQEYISVKRKQGSIKANSLDQYFQHIESYNMALGHGWEAEVFEPMMREVLEELERDEQKAKAERKQAVGNEDGVIGSEPMDIVTSNHGGIAPSVTLVCFDTSHSPLTKLENSTPIPLANLDSSDTPTAIRHLYDIISKTQFPKRWGDVDTSKIYYYRSGSEAWNNNESQHHLLSEESFGTFWSALMNPTEGSQIQLVVHGKRNLAKAPPMIGTDIDPNSASIPVAPLTPRKSPPRNNPPLTNIDTISASPTPSPTFQQVKSVTIRSPTKIYKENVAVTDTTTFESLLRFVFKKSPPSGKQFVLQSLDGELEYIPEELVRKAIYGMNHADILVKIEDVSEVDFNQF